MKTFINDVELDWSTSIPIELSFKTTDKPVQNSNSENIVTHVRKILPNIKIDCSFNREDRGEKFQQLLELANKKELVILKQTSTFENLIITNISKPSEYENVISFSIEFKQLQIGIFEVLTEPLPESLQQLQEETVQGLQSVRTSTIVPLDYPPS